MSNPSTTTRPTAAAAAPPTMATTQTRPNATTTSSTATNSSTTSNASSSNRVASTTATNGNSSRPSAPVSAYKPLNGTTTTTSGSSSSVFAPSSAPASATRPGMPHVYLTTTALPTRKGGAGVGMASTSTTATTATTTATATASHHGASTAAAFAPSSASSSSSAAPPALFDFRKTDKSPSGSYSSTTGGVHARPTSTNVGGPSSSRHVANASNGSTTTSSSPSPTPTGSALGLTTTTTTTARAGAGASLAAGGSSLLSQQLGGARVTVPGGAPASRVGGGAPPLSASTASFGRRMSSTASQGPPTVPRMRPRALSVQMRIKGELRQDGAEFSDIEDDDGDEDDEGLLLDDDEGALMFDDEDNSEDAGSGAAGGEPAGAGRTGKSSLGGHAKVALVNGKAIAGVGTGSGGIKGRRKGMVFRCESCAKVYRHPSCLSKHRWEHSPHWGTSSKLLLSKHQQVQLLEAATILVHLDPSNPAASQPLPEDKSLWPAAVSSPPSSTSASRGGKALPTLTPWTPSSSLPNPPSSLALRKPSPGAASSSSEDSERDSGYSSGHHAANHQGQGSSASPAATGATNGNGNGTTRPSLASLHRSSSSSIGSSSPLPPRQSMLVSSPPPPSHGSGTPGSYGNYPRSLRTGSIGDLGFSSFHIGSQGTAVPSGNSLTPPSNPFSQIRSPNFANLALPQSSLRSGTILDDHPDENDEDDEDDDAFGGANGGYGIAGKSHFAGRSYDGASAQYARADSAERSASGSGSGSGSGEDREKEDMDWEMEM